MEYIKISSSLKEKRFKIIGTRGWNEAEFTSGGINAEEVNKETMESIFKKNLTKFIFSFLKINIKGQLCCMNLAIMQQL